MESQIITLLDQIKNEGPINKINPEKQASHSIGYNYARKFGFGIKLIKNEFFKHFA